MRMTSKPRLGRDVFWRRASSVIFIASSVIKRRSQADKREGTPALRQNSYARLRGEQLVIALRWRSARVNVCAAPCDNPSTSARALATQRRESRRDPAPRESREPIGRPGFGEISGG